MASQQRENWLKKPNVSWLLLLFVVIFWTTSLIILDRSQIMGDLKVNVSRPFDFRVRAFLGQSPTLDPKIKIFGLSDTTVTWLGAPDLDIVQWCKLILAFDQKKPAAIIIDKIFSIAQIPTGREVEAMAAIKQVEEIATPVYVGTYVASKKIPSRQPIDLSGEQFSYPKMVERADNREDLFYEIPNGDSNFVYGPGTLLRRAFKNIGHIMYDGSNMIPLFYRIGADRVLPHIMIQPWSGHKFSLGADGFKLNGTPIPTTQNGMVLLNLSPSETYLKHIRHLKKNIQRSLEGKPAVDVEQGDYVYIIPSFYTGNSDFKPTALGIMPGAYTHLAVLNSILTEKWLHPFIKGEIIFVLLACLIGGLIAKYANSFVFPGSMFLAILLWFATAIVCFSFYALVLPWLLPLLGFVLSAITIFVEKSRISERKSQFIRNCLDGVISADEIDSLTKNPELLSFSAREQVVSIMFIDVVGFSLVAENQLPRIAFDQLKFILNEITNVVHEYGGIVNKNLGDGLLCFFGYSLDQNRSTSNHAEKAVECAIEIQRRNLPKTIREHELGEPVFPLRIGINTSSVYLGNIGSEERIDLTIVGNGVNFAKRLEGACEIHSVLMGITTKELIDPLQKYNNGLSKKFIEIKHHVDMVESWEFDPYYDAPEQRHLAVQAHRQAIARVREDERWELPEDSPIFLKTNIGSGKVLNYSRKGMSIWLEIDVRIGTLLKIRLDDKEHHLAAALEVIGAEVILTETCWCLPYQGGYTYGLRYRELGDVQLATLLSTIKKHAPREAPKSAEPKIKAG